MEVWRGARVEMIEVNVTVRGQGLILSVIHLTLFTADSPLTFTVLVIFFSDTFQYIVW